MATVATVIPNSLNYADIKPQAVENEIRLNRFMPTSNINGAGGGDSVKFILSGQGFLDPYSTYFSFTVSCDTIGTPMETNEIRFLDRSAHSFFSKLIIKSQGTEIERIDQYDTVAAMINDMIYAPEQCTQHYWEGFPTHVTNFTGSTRGESNICEGLPKAHVADGKIAAQRDISQSCVRDELFRLLCQGSSPSEIPYIGETAFHKLAAFETMVEVDHDQMKVGTRKGPGVEGYKAPCEWSVDYCFLPDWQYQTEMLGGTPDFVNDEGGYYKVGNLGILSWNPEHIGLTRSETVTQHISVLYPVTFAYHYLGKRFPSSQTSIEATSLKAAGTTTMKFVVPIYSGVIGLLMPEKKLIPLNLLPLDIEVFFNEYALYSSKSSGSRKYVVNDFYIYGNMMFFEQEIHRTLEANVADRGLFIYCNSFHMAPLQLIAGNFVPSVTNITMNLKSINSVHWLFMYNHYATIPCARKLHFVSHNLTKMQILNGTTLIPQYAIEGNSGTSKDGSQLLYTMELYKAWNKMHDPTRDGALHAYNTCGDEYNGQMDPIIDLIVNWTGKAARPTQTFIPNTEQECKFLMMQIVNKQGGVGRAQYALSLEGEELGSDRTMITGRKAQYPFQIQLVGNNKFTTHLSQMHTFLRADYIIYLRPDLQVVTLGK